MEIFKVGKLKILDKIEEKYYCFFSFAIAALSMYLLLSFSGLLKSGIYCIMSGDMIEIYIPAIRAAVRSILNGESIYYSWSQSLGMNTALSLAYYGVFNPFNILFLLFHNTDPNILVAIIVVVKTGLAALTFQLFEREVLKCSDLSSLLFAISYALCSFQVSFNIENYIWMDALYVLPLALMTVYNLTKKSNPIPLVLILSYIFSAQFYMGYIVGIASFLFFFMGIWLFPKQVSKRKYIGSFILAVISAVCISAFVWLPALSFLLEHRSSDSTSFSGFGVNPLDVYNQLFFSNNSDVYGIMPNIYCGVLILVLLPGFIFNPQIALQEKLLYGIPSLFFWVGCFFVPMNVVLHAFDAPDGWMYRFSWAFSFFICCMGVISFRYISEIKKRVLIISLLGNVIIYLLELFWLRERFHSFSINRFSFFAVNMVLLLIWTAIIIWYRKQNQDSRKVVCLLMLLLSCIELIANGYTVNYKEAGNEPLPEYIFYDWDENRKELLDYLRSDPTFYRIAYFGSEIINSDTYSGFNGVSDFGTAENENVRIFLSHMGLATSPRVVHPDGLNPVSEYILGVKYLVMGEKPSIYSTEKTLLEIIETNNNSGLGYMVSDEAKKIVFTNNAIDNQNLLLKTLTGESLDVLVSIPKSDIEIEENGIMFQKKEDGYYFLSSGNGNSEDSIRFTFKGDYQKPYLYFLQDRSLKIKESMLITGELENRTEDGGQLSMSYLKLLDTDCDGHYYASVISNGRKEQSVLDYVAADLDEEVLEKYQKKLSSYSLYISDFKNGYIKGSVQVPEEKKVLLTTIPFDTGWQIFVDGERSTYYSLLDNAFIGIDLEHGEHQIEFKYIVKGQKEGLLLTIIGCVLVFVCFIWERDVRRKRISD